EVRPALANLLGRRLGCADAAGDRGNALAAARWLVALGESGGVAPDVWTRYPMVDATVDVLRQPLAIAVDPADASLSVDPTPAGRNPPVAAGPRLVSAAAGERAAALFVDVKENRAAQVKLELPAVDPRWAPIRAHVRAWRRAAGAPTAEQAGAVAAAAGA